MSYWTAENAFLKQELIGSVILCNEYMGVRRRIHVHCGRTMALLHAA